VRLTVNFYVKGNEGITFHGDDGSLQLDSWFVPNSPVTYVPYESEPEQVVPDGEVVDVDWSVGVADFVRGIEAGVPSQLSTERAVHMVAVLDAITRSGASGERVVVDPVTPV
jgi:predicted dehydrogenase